MSSKPRDAHDRHAHTLVAEDDSGHEGGDHGGEQSRDEDGAKGYQQHVDAWFRNHVFSIVYTGGTLPRTPYACSTVSPPIILSPGTTGVCDVVTRHASRGRRRRRCVQIVQRKKELKEREYDRVDTTDFGVGKILRLFRNQDDVFLKFDNVVYEVKAPEETLDKKIYRFELQNPGGANSSYENLKTKTTMVLQSQK